MAIIVHEASRSKRGCSSFRLKAGVLPFPIGDNKHELFLLLTYLGFNIETMFTADVHANHADQYADFKKIKGLVDYRINDLGQYIFLKARSVNKGRNKRPDFLYRSYPPTELESL